MTSPQTDVSEDELQHAIDAYDAVITHAADTTHFITGKIRREAFRAALTAAAQVRGRVSRGRSLTAEEAEILDRALMASTEHGLMPIYSATEDHGPAEPGFPKFDGPNLRHGYPDEDDGPSVLGERKGE